LFIHLLNSIGDVRLSMSHLGNNSEGAWKISKERSWFEPLPKSPNFSKSFIEDSLSQPAWTTGDKNKSLS